APPPLHSLPTRRSSDLAERFVSANIYRTDAPERTAFSPVRMLERTLAGGRAVRIAVVGATGFDALLTGARATGEGTEARLETNGDRKSTRLNSSHVQIS